jgi:uncharacterized protein (TIGR02996 family)
MTQEEAFLQAILERPDEDAPRLTYADWLSQRGDPRGEFIRVQCELTKPAGGDPRRAEQYQTQQALLEKHEAEWAAPLVAVRHQFEQDLSEEDYWVRSPAVEWHFRRGFVDELSVEPLCLVRYAPALLRDLPVQRLKIGSTWPWREQARLFRKLNGCPYLARVKSIELSFGCFEADDDGFCVLATLPVLLRRLVALSAIETDITEAGLGPLLCSPGLRELKWLFLSECHEIGLPSLQALAQWKYLGHLQALSLHTCSVNDAGIAAFAGSGFLHGLTELYLSQNAVTDGGVTALAESPHIGTVQHLWLDENRIGDRGAEALARSPYLKGLVFLNLQETDISPTGQQVLKGKFGERVYFG